MFSARAHGRKANICTFPVSFRQRYTASTEPHHSYGIVMPRSHSSAQRLSDAFRLCCQTRTPSVRMSCITTTYRTSVNHCAKPHLSANGGWYALQQFTRPMIDWLLWLAGHEETFSWQYRWISVPVYSQRQKRYYFPASCNACIFTLVSFSGWRFLVHG